MNNEKIISSIIKKSVYIDDDGLIDGEYELDTNKLLNDLKKAGRFKRLGKVKLEDDGYVKIEILDDTLKGIDITQLTRKHKLSAAFNALYIQRGYIKLDLEDLEEYYK